MQILAACNNNSIEKTQMQGFVLLRRKRGGRAVGDALPYTQGPIVRFQ